MRSQSAYRIDFKSAHYFAKGAIKNFWQLVPQYVAVEY